ncbi:MAG TPA: S8 family peptidase [Magnetospirillaceae bacterium]
MRLDAPAPIDRRRGSRNNPQIRRFNPTEQAQTAAGQKLTRLTEQLEANTPTLQLQADPAGLAPERLLVFELTGTVSKFEQAVRRIEGLEFLGAEDLDDDDVDENAVVYLMVPSEGALGNIVSLWRYWQRTGDVPSGFSAWKTLLTQLRDIRRWGPRDRIAHADMDVLNAEVMAGHATVRVEIELVFRLNGDVIEQEARREIIERGGVIVSHSRIAGAGYHALLADIPTQVLREALELTPDGLAGSDVILQIRPQSVSQVVPLEAIGAVPPRVPHAVSGDPIAAVFDAVPLSAHPQLAGTLSVDDLFGLEPVAVGQRRHGTAMASAVVHGDLNGAWVRPLERPVYFVNMLYATTNLDQSERFPDRLPADLFEQALVRMREGPSPAAPHVVVINASLGDANKPFADRMSGWARVVDYLASKYGVLFVISAGNHLGHLETLNMNATQFEDLPLEEKSRVALGASKAQMAMRRILAPAEAINAITVGALHNDQAPNRHLPASTFDVWEGTGLCTISSGLGPGHGGATKPDILAPGGRHHVRLLANGDHHRLAPLAVNAGTFGGIAVAVPPAANSPSPNVVGQTVGSSVAAALATGVAARAHEALEAAYPDFVALPSRQRAALLKALLVHGARWTHAHLLLTEILGPYGSHQSYRRKDNVRRYLGFGAYNPDLAINCADDRATLWGVGTINADEGRRFQIPWPDAMSGKPQPHGFFATLAWFSPARPGAVAYRAVRMKIVDPSTLGVAGIQTVSTQPESRQAHKGTVVHRRWDGDKAAAIASNGFIQLDVQREADDIEEEAHFAIVATLEMPGEAQVYTQVLNRVGIKPKVVP